MWRFALWENLRTTLIPVCGVICVVGGLAAGKLAVAGVGMLMLVGGGAWWLWDWRRVKRGDTRWLS
jgi:hypothetical protein